jgi:hypothetical protein
MVPVFVAALTWLPVAASYLPKPVAKLFVTAVHAGCQIGGCG